VSAEILERLAVEGRRRLYPFRPRVTVGLATCGRAAGAEEVYRRAESEIAVRGLDVSLVPVGCLGWCAREPLVEVWRPGGPRVTFGRVRPEQVAEILHYTATGELGELRPLGHTRADRDLAGAELWGCGELPGPPAGVAPLDELPFFRSQVRLVMRHCGLIDPEDLAEYVACGGYRALERALREGRPENVIGEVERAGLRGRGGAGFPTGRKWRLVRAAAGEEKYLIVNGDEGDPGAYMDRGLLESNPHLVLEGAILAAFAVGARQGLAYIRAEYPLAVERLGRAVEQAREFGLLGERILGSNFSFDLEVVRGAGAFVCGEETALMAAVEGGPGEPRFRPPYPAERGLWGRPTCINNVETLANVPVILNIGAEAYARLGTPGSRGTKIFSLVGDVVNGGLVEVPMGTTLQEILCGIGGGPSRGTRFKAVQTGGPSGGCLPAELFDLPVDYEGLAEVGTIMGSGGLVALSDRTCMVDLARYFLYFTTAESCGKCTPCREGLHQMLAVLERLREGRAAADELEWLAGAAEMVAAVSLCGLGQTAPNPVLTALRYFGEEVRAHLEGRCPAGVCPALTRFVIDAGSCDGCGRCRVECPVEAIEGAAKEAHAIVQERCLRCGLCREVCPTGAVVVA